MVFGIPDPRKLHPKHADPEHRSRRKELEKKHGYGYTEPLLLAALGIGLVWNIENQVEKHEQRKEEEEKKEKERQRRRDENRGRSGTWHPSDDWISRGPSGRFEESRDGSARRGSDYRDEYSRGLRDDPRMIDYRDYQYRGYRDEFNDHRNDYRYADRRDGSVRRSSRRDSL